MSVEDGSDDGALSFDMFQEPKTFRPPTPPPTEATYTLTSKSEASSPPSSFEVRMSLVGSHPLWAHHLWNAAPTLSDYLIANQESVCKKRSVVELGAGAGLPTIVAHRLGADVAVATDYPDPDLCNNLRRNASLNKLAQKDIHVEGYIWGTDVAKLQEHLSNGQKFFDVVLLSDLIFNHQAHAAMLDTLHLCLPPASSEPTSASDFTPQALVFFTHHRPHLAHKDMAFFESAKDRGWTCEQVGQWKMPPMFPEDPGSEEVRGTVHGWRVFR